jgi:hypothetical protein
VEVEYAFLADAADAPPGGKLYALGVGIDQIRTREFPTTHALLAFVVKLKLHPTECDRTHNLEIELWDPDGQRLTPRLSGEFGAARNPEHPTRPVLVQMVLNLFGTTFPRPGEYEFHIIVNHHHLKTVPLYVEQADAAEPASPRPESQ